jgi:dTDP-4-amino-4,6-dideoxygalactose transaminase
MYISAMKKAPVRSKANFLVFGSPSIGDAEIEEVTTVLKSGWIGTGPKVAQFEKAVAAYKTVPYVAAVNSCTAALHLSMLAAGIGKGDEVITTAMTFCATVNAIIHAGATPVLADIDPVTMNVSPHEIRQRLTQRTRAIVPVHFAGMPCEMDALLDIAEEQGLTVIEDCAHAIETEYKGRKAGTIGNFGCLSFYVTKNVVTGEGGMVLAGREEDIARIKILALHGMTKDAWKRFSDEGYRHYQVVEAGFKYNMTDLQAAIGIHQMARVEQNWHRRRQIWSVYNKAFMDLPVGLPADAPEDCRHGLHLYTLRIDRKACGITRDEFLSELTYNNIGAGVHYLSIPEHPFYREQYGWVPEDYPNAARLGRETVSLPFSAKLSDDDVSDVIKAVRSIIL